MARKPSRLGVVVWALAVHHALANLHDGDVGGAYETDSGAVLRPDALQRYSEAAGGQSGETSRHKNGRREGRGESALWPILVFRNILSIHKYKTVHFLLSRD